MNHNFISKMLIVESLCVLTNGELLSAGGLEIKLWRINDYHLIHTLTAHTDNVRKVTELKDGKICSCSDEQTIIIWYNCKCIKII